jgi:hypothetical protein
MKSLVYLILLIMVPGCTKTAADYANMPSTKLCIEYLNAGDFDLNQSAREEVLSKRTEDCAAYLETAARIKAADTRARAAASAALIYQGQQLMNQGQPRFYSSGSTGTAGPQTQYYNLNGRNYTCTTLGSVTNCF